jgi:hypothetical protein
MRTSLVVVFGLVAAASASAREPVFQDQGVSRDPYTRSAIVMTGRIEGFRKLYVDPATFADTLTPVAPIVVEPIAPPVAASQAGGAGETPAATEGAAPEPAPRPTAPSLPPRGDLVVENVTSAWADIAINGQKVGRIGPIDHAVLHDVKTGIYEITFTHPDGHTWSEKHPTIAPTR